MTERQVSGLEAIRSELARIKALEEKATKGPWLVRFGTCNGWEITDSNGNPLAIEAWHGGLEHQRYEAQFDADGLLISAARTDVPRLVSALEEAVTRLEMIRDASKRNITAEDAANGAMFDAREALGEIAARLNGEGK